MAQSFDGLVIANRKEGYRSLTTSLEALLQDESDLVANLATAAAAIHEVFRFHWVGFYLAKEGQLVLGPFQGPVACLRISFDKGVCGACYTKRETIVVPDVDQFPGHIACSALSRSEIVVPVFNRNGSVAMILDVDSAKPNDFTQEDAEGLEAIVHLLERRL